MDRIGSRGETSVIAGDSTFISTLGKISQKDLANLPFNDPSLLIMGSYQYCDEVELTPPTALLCDTGMTLP